MVKDTAEKATKWQARAVQARLVRVAVSALPVMSAVTVSLVAGRVVPRPGGLLMIPWWVALAGLSTVTLVFTDKLARRFLPLATLLQLTLAFPDRAPSRFSIAMRSGNVARLEKEVAAAARDGLPVNLNDAVVAALTMVTALNHHDRGTRGHSERVRAYAEMLGDELGLSVEQRDRLRWGALLHDVGKLTVPGEILNKPGKPDEAEWAVLARHPLEGERILAPLSQWLGDAVHCAGQHHERWDGRGYPRGLRSSEISWAARIVAVADSYAVMTAPRSYKTPMSTDAARKELARCAGSQFDPVVVRAMLNLSLGRLRTMMGPLASLANLPFVATAAAAGGAATTAATATATMGFVVAANVAPIPVVHELARPQPVVEVQAMAAEAPESPVAVDPSLLTSTTQPAPPPDAGFVVETVPATTAPPTTTTTTRTTVTTVAAGTGATVGTAPPAASDGVSFITSPTTATTTPPETTAPPVVTPESPDVPSSGDGDDDDEEEPVSSTTTKPKSTTTTRPKSTTTTRPKSTTTSSTTTTTLVTTTTTEGVPDGAVTDSTTTTTVASGPTTPTVTVGDPTLGGWQLNGSASLSEGRLRLTPNETWKRGSVFWPTALNTDGLEISFSFLAGPNDTGADGLAVIFADPATAPTSIGNNGGGLGFAGITGSAVTFDTYRNSSGNDPNGNFIGWATTQPAQGYIRYLATSTNVPDLDRTEHRVLIRVTGGEVIVFLNDVERLRVPSTLGTQALIGISAATGGATNAHWVTNVQITAR